jgi:hypothetical protein
MEHSHGASGAYSEFSQLHAFLIDLIGFLPIQIRDLETTQPFSGLGACTHVFDCELNRLTDNHRKLDPVIRLGT